MVRLPPPVDRPVTIAVAGTHSTGKSTFLAQLAHVLRREGLAVSTVADLGEQAQRLGFPILSRHTWISTLWIITQGISNELAAWIGSDVVLVDRPVPDALAYYRAALDYRAEQPDAGLATYLAELTSNHTAHAYDLIFHTRLDPTVPLGKDKPRDTDDAFRVLADHHVGRVLADLRVPSEPLMAGDADTALPRAIKFAIACQSSRRAATTSPNELARAPWRT